ncbi:uncharacterized protein [Antedon mediterranea]
MMATSPRWRSSSTDGGRSSVLLSADSLFPSLIKAESEAWKRMDSLDIDDDSSPESSLVKHGNSVQSIHSYFKNLDSNVCCMNLPGKNANAYSKIRVPQTDGRDSGIEDGTISGIDSDRQHKNVLDQREFSVYKRALLCAQFPVLGSVSPPSSASNSLTTNSFQHTFNFIPIPESNTKTTFSDDSEIDDDTDTSIQVQTLCVVVRQAFNLSEERHLYYDDIISEGYNRKSPAKILIDELVSRLRLLENNKHPFYSPFAFENRNAYDLWQQQERRTVIKLYSKFWHYALPSASSSLCKPMYWASTHEEYKDLMIQLIRSGNVHHNVLRGGWILSSSSRRLLKEFGLRYGVGDVYRKAVYLEYLANNLEIEVWYLNHMTHVVGIVVEMISQIRTRMLIVRKEYEVLYKAACKLHDHCSHCFTRLQRLFSDHNPTVGVESLINLLAKVVELKTYLTGKKCSSLEYYLQKYMKDSVSLAYERYKLIGTTELKLNSYTTPLSPRLMNLLLLNIRNEVDHFQVHYQEPFGKFFDLTALAAREFYNLLMQDVCALCEQCLKLEHSNEIDLMMLSLAYRLNQLDIKWKQYIPIRLQVWRHQFHSQAKLWLDVLRQHVLSLVIQAVSKDTYKTLLLPKEGYPEIMNVNHRPRNSSFLQASQTSAFSAVTSSTSPITVEAEVHHPELEDLSQKAAAITLTRRQVSTLSTLTPLQMENPFSSSVEKEHLRRNQEQRRRCFTDVSQQETKALSKDVSVCVSSEETKEQLLSEDDSTFYTPTPEMDQSQFDDEVKLLTNEQSVHQNEKVQDLTNKFLRIGDSREVSSSATTSPCSQYEDAFSYLDKDAPIKFIGNYRSGVLSADHLSSSVGSPRRFVSPEQLIQHRGFLLSASSFETASEGTFYPRSLSPSETRVSSRTESPGLYPPHTSALQQEPMDKATDMIGSNDDDSVRGIGTDSEVGDPSEPPEKMPFSNSVVDMVCIVQRFAEFMQSLCNTIYPIVEGEEGKEGINVEREEVGEGGGDSGTFTPRGSMATASMSWNDAAIQMREELAIKMYMTVTDCLQLYANNMLSIDLCATPSMLGSTLITSQVLDSITFNKKQGLIWGCRHMLNGSNNCNKYLSRDAEYVSDAFEPVTEEMCVRINNIAALLNLMPSFNGLLSTVVGDLQSPLYMGMADLHENLWHQCECHLQQVIEGQVKLLAHKLNLFVHQAIKLLTNLNMVGYTISKRLQPITEFLDNHMIAFSNWLYPEFFEKFSHALWENIVQDFKSETEMLKSLDDKSDNHALLLLQALGHMIEFMYHEGDGLDIDVLIKHAEHTMYLLQLHSMDTRQLICLYKQLLSQKMNSSDDSSSLSTCNGNNVQLPSADVLHCMYRDLHAIRKCFSGHQLLHWIQNNTASEDALGVCQKLLDHKVIQAINISQNRSKHNDTPTSCNSDSHIALTTSQVYPEISVHSTPHREFFRNQSISDALSNTMSDSDTNESCHSTDLLVKQDVEQGIVNEGYISDDVIESGGGRDNEDIDKTIKSDNDEGDELEFGYLRQDSFENLSQVGCEKELGAYVKDVKESHNFCERTESSESEGLPHHSSLMSPTSDLSGTSSQTSTSSRVFTDDAFHFYRFADVDDEELYSMFSHASVSSTSNRHHSSGLHARDKPINPEFVIFIIYNRRKVNKLAKSFSEGISDEIAATLKRNSNRKYCLCLG